jgi:hypothetical protein
MKTEGAIIHTGASGVQGRPGDRLISTGQREWAHKFMVVTLADGSQRQVPLIRIRSITIGSVTLH